MCHESAIEMSDDKLSGLFEAVIGGLYDYSADSRGDCGSWVRVSAMKSLPKILKAIIRRDVVLDRRKRVKKITSTATTTQQYCHRWKNEYQKN